MADIGLGARGVMDPVGDDPLFSQGAIHVSGNNLFTVNVSVMVN